MNYFGRFCSFNFLGILFLTTVASAGELLPTDWPQWRGPTRDSKVIGKQWPDSLDENHLELSWEVKRGPSYSGPIVVGNRVFTTETDEQKIEVVYAYDKITGDELWRTEWEGHEGAFFAASNGSWIRTTPACDGETIYVAGMCDVLYALDCATGKIRWDVDFKKRFDSPMPAFGFASSPLVHGDAIFARSAALSNSTKQLGKLSGELQTMAAVCLKCI